MPTTVIGYYRLWRYYVRFYKRLKKISRLRSDLGITAAQETLHRIPIRHLVWQKSLTCTPNRGPP